MPSIRITVTVPKEVFNQQDVVDRIVKKQRDKTIPDLRKYFQDTVIGWKGPPVWGAEQFTETARIGAKVFATGANAWKYGLVNAGSPKHRIPARPGGLLRFQLGYASSTRPRVLRSKYAWRFGPFVSYPVVEHPGFDPRDFLRAIAEDYADTFADDMQNAIVAGILRK